MWRVILSSLLFTLSFPPVSCFPCAFLFPVPLLHYLERLEGHAGRAFSAGLLWTVLSALGTAHFIFYAMTVHYEKGIATALLFFGAAVVIPYGILYGAFCAGYVALPQRSSFFGIILPPALWVTVEYLAEILPFTIPWVTIGHSAAAWPPYMQAADITGPYGLSFLIICTGSLIFSLTREISTGKISTDGIRPFLWRYRCRLTGLVILLLLPPLYGIYRTAQIHALQKKAEEKNVLIIQGNFTHRERWRGNFNRRINTYAKLTREKGCPSSAPLLVIWPETVLNDADELTPGFFSQLRRALPAGTTLVSGGVRHGKGKKIFNSAWIIESGKKGWYDKQILLPFGETGNIYPLMGGYYRAPSDFAAGYGRKTRRVAGEHAGFAICFEAVYPGHFRRAVAEGAVFLINISNDAWFGRGAMPQLHLDIARLRAVENRRCLLRASNSGVSAIIDATGKILHRTELFERAGTGGSFHLLDEKTIYTGAGDWPVLLSLGILLLVTGRVIFLSEPA